MSRGRLRDQLRLAERRAQSPFGLRGPIGGFFGGDSRRLGYVGTRTLPPYALGPDGTPYAFRAGQFAPDDISGTMQVAWANWYSSESPIPGVLTMEAYLEYPAGVLTRMTFAGINVGTAPSGTTLWGSVTIPGTIPAGAQYWLRYYQQGTQFIAFSAPLANTNVGDASIANSTVLTGPMANVASYMAYPAAIVGLTRRKSYAVLGDSLQSGTGQAQLSPSPGNIGELSRGIGAGIGIANFGLGGTGTQEFIASHTLRSALITPYAYGVLNGLGAVDLLINLVSAATLKARMITIRNYFPTLRYWAKCIDPQTDSTDLWATLINQTPRNGMTQAAIYNADLRANPTGIGTGIIDPTPVTEGAVSKWVVTGAPNYATVDGGHPTETIYQLFNFPGYGGLI